jgi:hypothetical protein
MKGSGQETIEMGDGQYRGPARWRIITRGDRKERGWSGQVTVEMEDDQYRGQVIRRAARTGDR